MTNSIDAHIEFSFKGKTHLFSTTIDLDRLALRGESLEHIHQLLAAKGGIDTYSYEYDVMLEEEIRFDHAQGLAAEFLQDGHFDLEAFAVRWHDEQVFAALRAIASETMGIADLEQHPQLKNALLQAYRLGAPT